MNRHVAPAASLVVALLLAAAASLPAVWWEPLHMDEAITLELSQTSTPAILRDVFIERGGAPAFFLVEHLSLQWPGGLAGLRLPPLAFLLVAVIASAPVARTLGGRDAALLLPPLLAVAPLTVRLATFGRMYMLFLAAVLIALWLLLRAVSRPRRAAWILAGAVTGALVYVHPIAPLYGGLALVTAWLHSGTALRRFAREARPGLLALVAVAAPYVYALAVLSRRYGVGSPESSLATSSSGRSVPVETLLALAPGGRVGAALLLALATWGLVSAVASDRRTGIALGLWLAAPLAFFGLVPSETAFFARYLLPALPFFLLLVVLGCLAAGRFTRRPLPVAAVLVAALVAWQAAEAASRLERLRELRLGAAVGAVAESGDAVLFSSTGSPVAGRPAELLDAYAALALSQAVQAEVLPAADPGYHEDIDARGVASLSDYLAADESLRRGVWLLSATPGRVHLAARRLDALPDVETRRISPGILLVRSREPLTGRGLVEQSLRVRAAWLGEKGRDRWSRILIDIERRALAASR